MHFTNVSRHCAIDDPFDKAELLILCRDCSLPSVNIMASVAARSLENIVLFTDSYKVNYIMFIHYEQ